MVGEKIAVNGTTSAKAIFHVMPERDAGFAKLPAEIDFFPSVKSREIDQAGIDVLQLTAEFLDLLDRCFETSRRSILAGTKFRDSFPGGNHTASHCDALRNAVQFAFAIFVFLLELNQFAQKIFYFRQQTFGF